MILASDWYQPSPLCLVDELLATAPSVRDNVELDVFVAFGHTALPTDWRTRAQIEAGVSLYGVPDPM